MRREIMYYEFSGGRWGAWVPSDGKNYYVIDAYDLDDILEYAARYGYQPVLVN
jgi:hypothetical protein